MTRINTNVQSLIAQRVMGRQTSSLNQALERLSTGLRINTGRDDPAGLIASESLRSTLTALDSAVANARRADSVLSVAEGSLQEVNAMLLELESLIDRSASEGGLTQDEVSANQRQIDTILDSINRIADSASFNDINLLNGNLSFTTSNVTSTQLSDVQIHAAKIPNNGSRNVVIDVQASSLQARLVRTGGVLASATTLQVRGNEGTELLSFAQGTATSAVAFAVNSTSELTGITASATAAGTSYLTFQSVGFGADAFVDVSVLDGAFAMTKDSPTGAAGTRDTGRNGTIIVNGTQAVVNGLEATVNAGSMTMDITLAATFAQQTATSSSFQVTGGGAVFAISPDVGLAGQATIGLASVNTGSLGKQEPTTGNFVYLSSLGSGQANDLNSKNFAVAQNVVRKAIDQVSTLRGRIGAFQKNTLDSAVSSMLVTHENITAAESAIRDADFAVETSAMTRAQILVNSSLLTLQTANQQPASVLQLLG